MKYLLTIIFFNVLLLGSVPEDYFQQDVHYEIQVTLNDSDHTLSAYENLIYKNNSPDTLGFIWFHVWPNAYKNNETAFAKQHWKSNRTDFYFSSEKERGYLDSLDFAVNGLEAQWEYHPKWIDVIKLFLPEFLPPDGEITIETPFFVKLPKVFSRLGHTGKHYEITQWFPKPAVFDRDGWHPMPYLNMGEFYSEFGSFDVKITLPEDYRIMATGDLVNGDEEYAWLDSLSKEGAKLREMSKKEIKKWKEEIDNEEKTEDRWFKKFRKLFSRKQDKIDEELENISEPKMKTLHFHQDNVHDFAWFADQKYIVQKGDLILPRSNRKVTLWSFYLPKNAWLWQNSIEYLHDSGYWYSQFCGDYPYAHITAVDGDLSAGGGMEYPNITVISKMGSKHLLEMVIMHEVGHNWFYGILGNNERDHVWMDEGLNEFNNIRYWDKKYGEDNLRWEINEFTQKKLGPFSIAKNLQYGWSEYAGYSSWIKNGDEEPLETSSNDFEQRANYWLCYSKPMLYSWHLLHYLGEVTIDNIFHNYYDDWKFKHPQPDDYFSYFSKYSDKNLDWYTHDVFFETGMVDYSVKIQKNEAVFNNLGTLTLPFEVAFYDNENNEISRRWYDNVNTTYRFPLPDGVASVVIDPDQTLPDINRPNNTTSKPLAFTWVFDQPQYYKNEIFWLPWFFSGNTYNGWTPGLNFYNGFVPGYNHGIGFTPMWDTRNDQLIGSMKYVHTMYGFWNYYTSTFMMDAGKNSGQTGVHFEFQGKRKTHLESYPIWTTALSLDYHNLREVSMDTSYYTPGEIAVGSAELTFQNRTNPLIYYSFKTTIKAGLAQSQFVKLNFQTNLHYTFTKKIKGKLRIWTGGFINKNNLPNQYLTYLSGSIDPDFRHNFIINRTGRMNDISVGTRQYSAGGPGMRGLVLKDDKLFGVEDWVFSANFDISLPKMPANPFLDMAVIQGEDPYVDFGIKKSIGPFVLIIPLFQSWGDEEPFVKDVDWLLKRMRFSLNIAEFNPRKYF